MRSRPRVGLLQDEQSLILGRYERYDRIQAAFRQRMQEAGLEAVAFNFAAGNFTQASHYLDYFPRTLASYVYLGFHEYGWPALNPHNGTPTSAGIYRRVMAGVRAKYGDRHRVIMTEAGLTRAYGNPQNPDHGWLDPAETLSEDFYWESSLAWYNRILAEDAYVLGACLYEVGHHGDWASFRHLGEDNQGNPLHHHRPDCGAQGSQPCRSAAGAGAGAAQSRAAHHHYRHGLPRPARRSRCHRAPLRCTGDGGQRTRGNARRQFERHLDAARGGLRRQSAHGVGSLRGGRSGRHHLG